MISKEGHRRDSASSGTKTCMKCQKTYRRKASANDLQEAVLVRHSSSSECCNRHGQQQQHSTGSSTESGERTANTLGTNRSYGSKQQNLKRRKKRKRPPDSKQNAIRTKVSQIDKALRWPLYDEASQEVDTSSKEGTDEENEKETGEIQSTTKKTKSRRHEDKNPKTRIQELAMSEHGLINDDLRRRAWPKLVGVDMLTETSVLPTQEEVEAHKSYNQVVLDVSISNIGFCVLH